MLSMWPTLQTGLIWFWDNATNAIAGFVGVWIATWLLRRVNKVLRALQTRLSNVRLNASRLRGLSRYLELRELKWLRTYRFDTVWIDREVSCAHTSLIIFVLWFGLWIIAMGMKEALFIAEGPLIRSPGVAVAAALPMYLFEVFWIRHSGRAAKLIKHRQRIRAWRFKR